MTQYRVTFSDGTHTTQEGTSPLDAATKAAHHANHGRKPEQKLRVLRSRPA